MQIKNWITGSVMFEAELGIEYKTESESIQLGALIKLAVKARANLYGADLRSADLRSADLYGANLYGANLRSADLRSANLYGADLRSADLKDATGLEGFRSDIIAEILKLPNELEALRQTLVEGKIDGSVYSGECACLAGTLARLCGVTQGDDIPVNGFKFEADSNSPREVFFMNIRKGDTPESNACAKMALEWIDQAIAIRDHIRKVA